MSACNLKDGGTFACHKMTKTNRTNFYWEMIKVLVVRISSMQYGSIGILGSKFLWFCKFLLSFILDPRCANTPQFWYTTYYLLEYTDNGIKTSGAWYNFQRKKTSNILNFRQFKCESTYHKTIGNNYTRTTKLQRLQRFMLNGLKVLEAL